MDDTSEGGIEDDVCVLWKGPVRLAPSSTVLAFLPELCVLKWLSIS